MLKNKRLILHYCIFLLLSQKAYSEMNKQTHFFENADGIDLTVVNGTVKIIGTTEEKTKIDVQKENYAENCELKISESSRLINVNVEPKDSSKENCLVNFEIQLPLTNKAIVNSHRGNVYIDKMQGELDVLIIDGKLEIDNSSPKSLMVTGKSKSEIIILESLGPGQIFVENGLVELTNDKPTKQVGTLAVTIEKGHLEVTWPLKEKIETKYSLINSTFTGKIGKKFQFDAVVKSGEINLKKEE